ncbi:MAG: NifB/NifX family molybdenum-iron cluster-binding protein [Deltaproteobacteria bacterium]|nr:NifB/NifX family molybdenum-iron cluster-binding protein [Deltaproteobacteria bacterium]
MKIAVSAVGSNLDAKVANRFSATEYLLLIDIDTGEYEAVPNPFITHQNGAGVQAVALAVSKGAKAILTGYISPAVANRLRISAGIEILTGLTGTAREALEQYRKTFSTESPGNQHSYKAALMGKDLFIHSIQSTTRQFVTLLPVLLGVVLLIGLFDAFISRVSLTSIFSGNMALDTLLGACFGSIFAGNPINSYIIGGKLLKYGVSLFAVTAFIVTWVTVGLVQLPAEIAAFGKRFALLRNGLSFLLSIPIAIFTLLILNLMTR